ncbi:MAG: hypothetical protein V3S68_04865 [Dehalococcoidia bacterium]
MPRPRARIPAVLIAIGADLGLDTTRGTLLTPSPGKALEILRVKGIQTVTDGLHRIEIYFDDGATIATSPEKAIDILRISDLGEDTTLTHPRGAGRIGLVDEVLSARHQTTPGTVHTHLIWYSEIDPRGGGRETEPDPRSPLLWTA